LVDVHDGSGVYVTQLAGSGVCVGGNGVYVTQLAGSGVCVGTGVSVGVAVCATADDTAHMRSATLARPSRVYVSRARTYTTHSSRL
jgi:hypothetical protein